MTSDGSDQVDPVLRAWILSLPSPACWVDAGGTVRVLNGPFRNVLDLPAGEGEGAARSDLLRAHLAPRLLDARPLLACLHDRDAGMEVLRQVQLVDREPPPRVWLYRSDPLLAPGGERLGWRETLTELRPQVAAPEPPAPTSTGLPEHEALARLSHELRTPMTAILGFCHVLLKPTSGLPPEQLPSVQKILRNAAVMTQLVTNVLDLSRIEAGRMALAREPIDCEALVTEALEAVEPLTWGRDLTITCDLQAPCRLRSDRVRLRQVLVNLLANAVKFTPAGHIGVTIGPAAGGVEFAVTDTGEGIAADQLERVFEPYVQGAAAAQQRVAGTGLGLAICRRILDLLGGRIGVTSTLGEGSTFTVWVPLEPPPPASASAARR